MHFLLKEIQPVHVTAHETNKDRENEKEGKKKERW